VDLNLALVVGRLSAEPDIRVLDSGDRVCRLLVVVRSEEPHHRLDVLPVIWWEPDDEVLANPPVRGDRIWMTGSVHRRFWDAADGRHSRIEIIARNVTSCSTLIPERASGDDEIAPLT
jgi:single-stranded DNA-binding protein